ncbi:DUF3375 domain-containing protein [Pseudoclavibacter soli]|uniref:DUF3375 domain-containing protein n=1 Tax=Pseudoclavibacter soli TaxID=452623 RepID=UPI0003F9B559|nr:DUF3375 domain-containing protein [Pseudoclavibacter soli]
MSAVSRALELRRLVDEHASLRMLRMTSLPVAAAVLAEHMSATTRMPVDDLHELVDADLDRLREHFPELALTGRAYCTEWRQAGLLRRRPAEAARGETYELTPAALSALRYLSDLQDPRTTVTESRLVSLAAQLHGLALETDPDTSRRIVALERQRDELEERIQRIRRGEEQTLDAERARERVDDILQQAQALPTDFARVRDRFEQLGHDLRARILDSDDAQRSVLDDIFHGVNLIADSEAGRTFQAFAALVLDPERSEAFADDIDQVLSRDFAEGLERSSRRELSGLLRQLKISSRDVHRALTDFARGLRRFVQSQEFQREREMRILLRQALAEAVPALGAVSPLHSMGELSLTGMTFSSISQPRVHDPSVAVASTPLAENAASPLDLAELRALVRESEIDFAELITDVNDSLAAAGAPVSVGEVLARHPATQGLASVVGLLTLAVGQGVVDRTASEHVGWSGQDGCQRTATVVRHEFHGRVR